MIDTELVGIVNVTPDSFSDGGRFLSPDNALGHARKLWSEGATIVDIGGQSTRPGAQIVPWEEEWARVEPIVLALVKEAASCISLDTYYPQVAEKFFQIGGQILNAVAGVWDDTFCDVCAQYQQYVILNHIPNESNIKNVHEHNIDSISQVREELLAQKVKLIRAGLRSDHIILDPGIGFGKTLELNRQLLTFALQVPEESVMIGYSRKRFLGEERFELKPNLEAGRIAALSGAKYLRVHDVAAHKELLDTLTT